MSVRTSNNPSKLKRAGGFTLIELIITLAVAAILVTVGIPGFQTFMANQKTRSASQALFSDLLYARSEAIKRNESVTVTRNGTWTDGWEILDASANTIREHEGLENIDLDDGAGNSPVASVSFDRTGRLVGGGTPSFAFCVDTNASNVTQRLVTIDLSGRATLNRDGEC